jgi:hypothetical protein
MKNLLLALLFIGHCIMYSQVGIGTTTPNESALLDLDSNKSGLLIPRMTASERNAISAPAIGLLVYQTDDDAGFYFFNNTSSWVLLNTDGDADSTNELELPQTPATGDMSYWNGVSWDVVSAPENEGATLKFISGKPTWVGGVNPNIEIGDFIEGGVVFYIAPTPTDLDGDGDLDNGLICSTKNQGLIRWSIGANFLTTNATEPTFGKGAVNTNKIINKRGGISLNYAAGLARSYNGGGYSDWFLPSKEELDEVYKRMAQISSTSLANGGDTFETTSNYWSSTEFSNNAAWLKTFGAGGNAAIAKNIPYYVRAIRTY